MTASSPVATNSIVKTALSRLFLFFTEHEWLVPLLLFSLFTLLCLPGLSWGAPRFWNPDELIIRVNKALHGEWQFDQTNFDYPSLPKYVMYAIGKVVYGLGFSLRDFIISARLFSVLLGAAVIVLVYLIAREMGGGISLGLLAAGLTLSNSEVIHNAHFAHNDIYLLFFVTLTIFTLVKYISSNGKLWLYAAFLSVGLAASSKYLGVTLIIIPASVLLMLSFRRLRADLLAISETLFIGAALCFLGYVVGTPKALLWMSFYVKRVSAALLRQATYDVGPESVRGLIGQWGVLRSTLGIPVLILFIIAFAWSAIRLIPFLRGKFKEDAHWAITLFALVLSILAFDLPIIFSYNYQPRYFISFIPMLSLLAAFFIKGMFQWFRVRGYPHLRFAAVVALVLLIAWSMLRVVSVMLLFSHDARIPAGEFLESLPAGGSLEHTQYAPAIPSNHFYRTHTYPLVFPKWSSDATPANKPGQFYKYNLGEVGLEERRTDYLVIDSFIYSRFRDEHTCQLVPAECDLFIRLLAGNSDYRLIGDFKYSLPVYMPHPPVAFVNPEIRVYERVP